MLLSLDLYSDLATVASCLEKQGYVLFKKFKCQRSLVWKLTFESLLKTQVICKFFY